VGAGGRIPRDDPSVAGPSHPKVLGLQLRPYRAPPKWCVPRTQRSAPEGRHRFRTSPTPAFPTTPEGVASNPAITPFAPTSTTARKRGQRRRATRAALRRARASNLWRGSRRIRARGELHFTRRRPAARGSDPPQQAGIDRPRARLTSSPPKTAGPKSPMTRRSPTDASAGGAVVAAQSTRVVGWIRHGAPKCTVLEQTEACSRRLGPKPEARSCPAPPKRFRNPEVRANPVSGDGVERIDVHVKERFRRTISSR